MSPVHARILRVPYEYHTISEAVLESIADDTVLVWPGEYTEQMFVDNPRLTIASHFIYGQDSTFVDSTRLTAFNNPDADSNSVNFVLPGSNLRLIGVTIENVQNGSARPPGSPKCGGGLNVNRAAVSVEYCQFENNYSDFGAAILTMHSDSVHIDHCQFIGNTNVQATVAIDTGRAVISNCLFRRNDGWLVGCAILARQAVTTLEHCLVDSNGPVTARNEAVTLLGDSYVRHCDFIANDSDSSNPGSSALNLLGNTGNDFYGEVIGCRFISNIGWYGALSVNSDSARVESCLFYGNVASGNPAGSHFAWGTYWLMNNRYENNLSANWSCLTTNSGVDVEHCEFVDNHTLTDNMSASFYCYFTGNSRVSNCLFVDNTDAAVINLDAEPDSQVFINNYWGDPSGPYHATRNPDGLGDAIIGDVMFEPWLTEPPQHAAERPVPAVPRDFEWLYAYPNPFNATVRISFTVSPLRRELVIYNLLGEIAWRREIQPYEWSISWSPSQPTSGVYFAKLDNQVAKLVLMR